MQRGVSVVIMRGGTSKGVFVHAADVPPPGPERDEVVLDLMGSPDPLQIDGLGGTYSSTSKFVVVEPGDGGVDVVYWFAQVGVDRPIVDWSGNCGNLTSAVPAFAVDEGLVAAVEPVTCVRMRNGNTGVEIAAEVQVRHGRARADGDHAVAGVPGTGAPVVTRYLQPGGGVVGAELPTGRPADRLAGPGGAFDATLLDVTHPYAFVAAGAAGIAVEGADPEALNRDGGLLDRLEELRGVAAVTLGAARSADEAADSSPLVPRLVLVAEPAGGDAEGAALAALALSMGKVHRALPMTAALCLAAAARIEGTVPAGLCRSPAGDVVRLRHPRGTVEVLVDVGEPDPASGRRVRSVGVVRTARRLMDGTAYLRRGEPAW